ncbi:Fur family transcriptional regulator [Sphingobacterium bambusae]|uniref:Ferric uptake regulation protein n=1 Tax=Sphingobacterium bambusae TaxID=662858 RepID=A0ABW6BC74_9SPHI|nr:transcriptional repressor [Sphingobacterium bambusae]WPL49115.1 transcriptional repressor [Sphingobacterium bambusae]
MNKKENKIYIQARNILDQYLDAHKYRKTSERYAILEEIYSRKDHFDVETFYIEMKNKGFKVSRATVYNTMELFSVCGLVKHKHFGDNLTFYEKAIGQQQHDHIICTDCGKVVEFSDPRIKEIQTTVSSLLSFEIKYHNLNLYASCRGCPIKPQ